MASAICAVFPKSGIRISNASTTAWVTTEIKRERRRARRSRLRCSASPSTRHERNEPRLSSVIVWETLRGSSGITHLQRFFCEGRGWLVSAVSVTGDALKRAPTGCSTSANVRFKTFVSAHEKSVDILAAPAFWGVALGSPEDRRRARRDVRLRASSQPWTPQESTSSLGCRGVMGFDYCEKKETASCCGMRAS